MADTDSMPLAKALWQARSARRLLPMADYPAPASLEAAYALQGAVAAASGAKIRGWKIGAGDPALQKRFDLPGPFVGPLVEGLVHESGATLLEMPGAALECELTFRLGRDLAEDLAADDAALLSAIDAIIPSLEVIGRRFEGDPDGQGLRLVADGGINVEAVMGAPVPWSAAEGWPGVTATLTADGAEIATGTAVSAGLMPPATLLRWLLAQPPLSGRGLKAGDLVMTGTLTGVFPLSAGVAVEADFGMLGRATAQVA
ncbi:MAG: fumarylacetoacetate hydrolase family protein [Pseudomonadota bacterium]